MDSLPSSLLYFTQQLTNFTRNQIKINPLNTDEVGPEKSNQLRVSLPVNSIANMKSLTLHCKLSLTGVEKEENKTNGKFALVPRGGAAALLDRVTWSAGGIALDNSVTPYNVVPIVRDNLKKGSQKYMSDDKVLCGAIIEEHNGFAPRTVDQAITNFAGFTECEPSYLDLNLLPELQCTIQTGPASIIPWQAEGKELGEEASEANNSSECKYHLEKCYFSLEVIQLGSGLYDALTQRAMMERGSLDVPYPQFQIFTSSVAEGNTSVEARGSVSCMSLDRIMYVQRRDGVKGTTAQQALRSNKEYSSYTTQQQPVGPHPGSTTFAFTQAAHNFVSDNLETWQMTVNNAPMPLYNVHCNTESFAIAMNADDRSYSNARGGLVSSQGMWKENTWCAVQRLKFDEDPRRLSGLNLSSINSQIRVRSTSRADDSGGANTSHYKKQGLLITEQTSILRIGPGRAISVVS